MQPWDSLCKEFMKEQDCALSYVRGEYSTMKKLLKAKNSYGQTNLYDFIPNVFCMGI